MTKANDLASLLDANGDVVSTALDNVPPSNDASALTTGTLAAARLPADIVVSDASPELSADLDTNSNDINFGTNAKSNYGTSAQLMMYHDGSNGWIKGNNSGNNSIAIQSGGTGSVMISGSSGQNIISQQGDAAYLHHAGFAKLITTSTGVDVTGLVKTSNAYQVWLGANVLGSDGGLVSIGANPIVIGTDGTERFRLTPAGDICFNNSVANTVSGYSNQQGGGFVASDKHFEFATNVDRSAVEIGKNHANDGDLVTFRKQGTTVGSIGVGNTNRPYIGSGDAGLMFDGNTNSIYPWDTSTNNLPASDQVKLGYNATGLRFSNIHLNGRVSYDGSGGVRIDTLNHAYIRRKGTQQYQFDCGSFTAGQGKKIFTTNQWTAGGGSITVFQNAGFFGVGQFSFIIAYGGCAFTLQHGTSNYATFSVNLNTPSNGQTEVFLTMGYAMSDVKIFLNFDGYPYYGAGSFVNSVASGITMTEVAHHSLA